MPLEIKNLSWLKNLSTADNPELGQKLSEIIQQVSKAVNTMEQQGNFNVNGNPTAPPAPNALHVTAQNGVFKFAITDQDPNLYRGVKYYIEHDTDPQFTNPQPINIADARNHTAFLGNQTRYFRALKAYTPSAPSEAIYFGSANSPTAVPGGGSIVPPADLPSQGSGTGVQGQGLQGPGHVPYRGASTKAPIR